MVAHNARTASKHFLGHQSGNVSIIFALAALPVFFAMGMAIDMGRAYSARQALQSAADVAALAGAIRGGTPAEMETATLASFAANYDTNQHGTAAPDVDATAGSIKLEVTAQVPTTFMSIANLQSIEVNASATASTGSDSTNGPICLLALAPSAYQAIHVQGVNNMALNNCWGYANSTNSGAIHGVGNATATAMGFCVVGGYSDHSNYSPRPRTECPVVGDPYANTPVPALADCPTATKKGKNSSGTSLGSGTHTLQPGQYCGGIDASPHAEVTFEPGVYIIRNGPLHFQAHSRGVGENVVFYFYGSNTQLLVKAGASLDLKGRLPGESYEGFLFVQHPDSNPGAITEIWGGGDLDMDGILYLPTQQVEIRGNGNITASAKLFAMVAYSFYMRGNGTLTLNADAAGAGLPNILPVTDLPGNPRLVN